MGTMASYQLSRAGLFLALCAICLGSHGPRGRPGAMLLETEQAANAEEAALMELDSLLNLFQAKGKRGQDLAEKVLQPGQAGMWFGPRLGRRRRDVAAAMPSTASSAGASSRRRKRSAQMTQDGDVDNDIPWKLAELLRELQGAKRSPTPCDSSDINCLLSNIASGGSNYAPSEQEQRSRSEGNLVNFTPRLGRESGEQPEDLDGSVGGGAGGAGGAPSRQLRTDSEPTWGFSPRLGRRLLPPGTLDVHAPAGAPPSPASLQPLLDLERSRGGRLARSTSADKGAGSQGHAQL